jgi:hypothetical protein
MPILTLNERFNQTAKAKQDFKRLKKQHSRVSASFNWQKHRPTLDMSRDMIPLGKLSIDTDTQRDPFLSSRVTKLEKIVKNPCAKQFKRVIISDRKWENNNPNYVIVEGQGRALTAHAMGETSIPCDIYSFDNKKEEAEFFLKQGKDVHTIKDWEKHSVILNVLSSTLHNQALDLERVVKKAGIEYEPQKIKLIDCSRAYSGIRDAVLRSNIGKKNKAGSRDISTTVSIINLMVKYCAQKDEPLVLRSDLFYPMSEFVLSYRKEKTGLAKLEEKIISLQKKFGGHLTLDHMAISCNLNICKNMNDKRRTYKNIKKW